MAKPVKPVKPVASKPKPQASQAQTDLLGGLLGSLLGSATGQGAQSSSQGSQGGLDVGSLLQGLMGGAGQSQQGAGGLGGLEALLGGGGQAAQSTQSAQGGLDLGSLLGGLLGGGQSQQATSSSSGLGGLLGGVAGGGQSNSALTGIVQGLAQQLGLPAPIAHIVAAFVLSKLMGSGSGRSLNVEELSGLLNSQGSVDTNYVQSTGLVEELSQQSGLDPETASRSLTAVLNMMGGAQAGAPAAPKRKSKKTVARSS
jgi:hypothetical protein